MAVRSFAGVASLFGQRNETGLGVCMAFLNGRGNLRDHSDWIRSWPFAPLRARTQRDGPGNRDHAGDRRDRLIGGQNFVLALGTLSPSPLGNGPSVRSDVGPSSLSYGATGRVTEKVAPLPEPPLCARILPPCISTIALLMARPSPRPSRRISNCSNAAKIFSRNSG